MSQPNPPPEQNPSRHPHPERTSWLRFSNPIWLLVGGVVMVAVVFLVSELGQDEQDVARSDSYPTSSAAISPSPSVAESPSPVEENSPTGKPLDADAVLAMLEDYLVLYNTGNYIYASGYLSSALEAECGGATNLAFALRQNHVIERVDYDVSAVTPWGSDEPDMADVATIERYGGRSYRLVLGLPFVFERGEWKLADFYPIGVGAFC